MSDYYDTQHLGNGVGECLRELGTLAAKHQIATNIRGNNILAFPTNYDAKLY